MTESKGPRFPWQLFLSELVGTALLVFVGLSLVIFMFGDGTPVAHLLPSEGLRRLITGFLFGTTGALIALSPIGKESGAHINPAVTLVFRLMRKIHSDIALGYVVAQLLGAALGALPLLLWGEMGRSILFGATLPGEGYPVDAVILGETAATFIMISLLMMFLGSQSLRHYTPAIFPFLYAVMVYVEAPISGTSTNPARSFGPAIVSGDWQGWWIYWIGPAIGALAAYLVCGYLEKHIQVAKLYHFHADRHGLFHLMSSTRG